MRGDNHSGQKELAWAYQFPLLVSMTRQMKLSLFRAVQMQLHGAIKIRSLEMCRADRKCKVGQQQHWALYLSHGRTDKK
eukprot:14916319-Ditylum_brightwellii.AAC.1